jgi:hypothetical protein
MSERLTAGRERAHSTGVESAIQTLSNQKSLSAAKSRIAFLISGKAALSRLLYPGWCGSKGSSHASWQIAIRIHRCGSGAQRERAELRLRLVKGYWPNSLLPVCCT